MASNAHHDPNNKKSGGKFVRHNEISRDHIRLYNVSVLVVRKPTPAGEKPVTWLRVLHSSLVRLSKVCPEFAVPRIVPDSHARDDDVDAADADDVAEEEEEEEGEEEEDPPPPVPEGYEVVPSSDLDSISEFMIWSRVGSGRAEWHRGATTKAYPPNFTFRGKPFTHDARLDGNREVRGVNLTSDLEAEHMWVAIRAIGAAPLRPERATRTSGGR